MALPCLGISHTRTRRDLASKPGGGMSLVVKNGIFAHT